MDKRVSAFKNVGYSPESQIFKASYVIETLEWHLYANKV